MSESNAAKRQFLNEDTIMSVKEKLDVSVLNGFLMNTPEKCIQYINYCNQRAQGLKPEAAEFYELEIRATEALMQKMRELSTDIFSVNAEAWIDAHTNEDKKSYLSIVDKEDKVLSIFTGDKKLQKPTLRDLSDVVKALLKKGQFDSAQLAASQYLSVGNYTPKKEKQEPRKWSQIEIDNWVKDLNANLLEEKRGKQKVNEITEVNENNNDNAAAKGLTNEEVEKLRLLNKVITDTVAGHQDYQSRREVMDKYYHEGKNLNDEEEMLWAVNKYMVGAYSNPKLPESMLLTLAEDIEKFLGYFFEKRKYTKESIAKWRIAASKEVAIPNFKYLTTGKDLNPEKLKNSRKSYKDVEKWVNEQFSKDIALDEIVKEFSKEYIYTNVSGEAGSADYHLYTHLHTKDLIERIYSKVSNDPSNKKDKKKDKIDVAEIKLLLSTIIENGGIIDDAKNHPEILGLIGTEIQITTNNPTIKFGVKETLLPWIETIFNDVEKNIKKNSPKKQEKTDPQNSATKPIKEENASGTVASTGNGVETADLNNMLLLVETAFKNDVNQEDFVKEHSDLLLSEDGKSWKRMVSENDKKTKTTIYITSKQDFEKWVDDQYKIFADLKTKSEEQKSQPELVSSMKELITIGKEKLKSGISYKDFFKWLINNLLNRKMKEQKEGNEFKSEETIEKFAKNTFKEELKPIESQNATKLTKEEIIAKVVEMAKTEGNTFAICAKELRNLYKTNELEMDTKTAIAEMEEIAKIANPEMYADRMKRVKERRKKEAENANPQLPFSSDAATPIDEEKKTEYQVFEKVNIKELDAALWETIKKFETMEEVYNMAIEFQEAGKFNEGLSMCLEIMPKLKDSKEWTPEMITDWYTKNILNPRPTPGAEEIAVNAPNTSGDGGNVSQESTSKETDEDFKSVMDAASPKNFKKAVREILKKHEDNEKLRAHLLNVIKTGNGSHTRQIGKMPDGEIHKMLNNIKGKAEKFKENSEE